MVNKLDKNEIKDIIFFVICLMILIFVNIIPLYYNYKVTKIKDLVDNFRVQSQQLQTRYLSDQNAKNMIPINLMAKVYLKYPFEWDFKRITEICKENLKDNKNEIDYLKKVQHCYTDDIEWINKQELLIEREIEEGNSMISDILNRNNYLNIIFVTFNIFTTIYISNKFEKIIDKFKKLFSK